MRNAPRMLVSKEASNLRLVAGTNAQDRWLCDTSGGMDGDDGLCGHSRQPLDWCENARHPDQR